MAEVAGYKRVTYVKPPDSKLIGAQQPGVLLAAQHALAYTLLGKLVLNQVPW